MNPTIIATMRSLILSCKRIASESAIASARRRTSDGVFGILAEIGHGPFGTDD